MSYGAITRLPPPSRELICKAAIVGMGKSYYHLDRRAERTREPGYEPPTVDGSCLTAFERALADSGLTRFDIAAGKADVAAIIFCIVSHAIDRQFGGTDEFTGESVPAFYYYSYPWGWNSHAAHGALIISYYQALQGVALYPSPASP